MTDYHLAQLNIARWAIAEDDPLAAEFAAKLDAVNAMADDSPGFVWRLQDESGNATNIQAFDDPGMLVNMSVWESAEALFAFTYKSGHTDVMKRRKEWFAMPKGAYMVMWWVPAGMIPTIEEAKARLEYLDANGPTAHAFTFKDRFPAPVTGTANAAAVG